MKYRRLGKTGLRVSVVGIGTWQLGGEWGKAFAQDEVDRMFDAARECGVNLIDTAECYGPHSSEALIGAAIRRDREKWVVATKFGHTFLGHLKRSDDRSAADVSKQLDESLRALRTDYLDVYQFHSVRDAEFEDAEVRAVLEGAVRAGKVRHLGNSIGSGSEHIEQTEGSTAAGVGVLQVVYNRLDRGPEARVLPSCRRQDLGVLARVPLASGLLSGKYRPGARFAADDFRSSQDADRLGRRLEEAGQIARSEVPAGVPMARWALAWCLRHPAVTAVIPGCKSEDQVRSNAAAADLELVRDDHPQAWGGGGEC